MKTKRIFAGEYERSYMGRVVRVFRHARGGWMADAAWDLHLYTDRVRSKKEAIKNADYMLVQAANRWGHA